MMKRYLLCALLAGGLLGLPVLAAPTPKPAKPLPSKHQVWSDTVTELERAKKMLLADKAKDVGNHRAQALIYIQKAMQELRQGTQGTKH
jgi:hypothetical protein